MSKQEIIHAYRHLYRGLLHAVQFSKPARFVGRDQLRLAFREKDATFEAKPVRRTVWFLNNAAKYRGIEHKILKNLLLTTYQRDYKGRLTWKTLTLKKTHNSGHKDSGDKYKDPIKPTAYNHYDKTVEMLNKTMGLCLR